MKTFQASSGEAVTPETGTSASGQSNRSGRLGLDIHQQDLYELNRSICGYTYTTPLISSVNTKTAEDRFKRFAGSLSPRFKPENFDRMRERLQVVDKRERQKIMQAIGVLYIRRLTETFRADKQVHHAEFERMLDPRYIPTYGNALTALGIRIPFYWRPTMFQTLENLSRLPLDRCDLQQETTLSFDEWYNLFWNFATPFNAASFYAIVTSQQLILTSEYIQELAGYLKERLETFRATGSATATAPIVHYGHNVGRLAYALNATGKLPVPVISCQEKPLANPYMFFIPDEEQHRFRPTPMEPLTLASALDKYQPSLVLLTDLKAQQDVTHTVRAQGSVREYLCLGMPDTPIEGHGWDTWGTVRYKDMSTDKTITPPWHADWFFKHYLNHISRYSLHRYDSNEALGVSAAVSFHRVAHGMPLRQRCGYALKRIKTRF